MTNYMEDVVGRTLREALSDDYEITSAGYERAAQLAVAALKTARPLHEFTSPPDEPAAATRYMQRHMHAWIVVALQQQEEWVLGQLQRLEPGDRLCVHPRQTKIDGDWRGVTHTWETAAHVLPPRLACTGGGERVEYGPMPTCRTPGCGRGYGHGEPCL